MPLTAPRFHRLRIADLRRETPDAVSIAFAVPPDLAPHYRFSPGQYLTLRTMLDGAEVRRSYSICSAPEDGELRIAVKRMEGGTFSVWAQDALSPGTMLDVMTPTGRFGVAPQPEAARLHVGFAAGSGITPILSILRTVLAVEPRSRFFLFTGNRSSADIMFRETLADLKDRHLGRFSVLHLLSREEQDIPALNGRLDTAKAITLLRHLLPGEKIDHAFICGPEGMDGEIAGALRQFGVPDTAIHVERFVSAHGGRPRTAPAPKPEAPPHAVALVTCDGKRHEVPVAAEEAILDAALRAGLDLPYACKGGMCSTCRARLTEGKAVMTTNYALEPWELEAGFVLTCQARPTTPRVAVDYDQV